MYIYNICIYIHTDISSLNESSFHFFENKHPLKQTIFRSLGFLFFLVPWKFRLVCYDSDSRRHISSFCHECFLFCVGQQVWEDTNCRQQWIAWLSRIRTTSLHQTQKIGNKYFPYKKQRLRNNTPQSVHVQSIHGAQERLLWLCFDLTFQESFGIGCGKSGWWENFSHPFEKYAQVKMGWFIFPNFIGEK